MLRFDIFPFRGKTFRDETAMVNQTNLKNGLAQFHVRRTQIFLVAKVFPSVIQRVQLTVQFKNSR
jgi:hypothetical protein